MAVAIRPLLSASRIGENSFKDVEEPLDLLDLLRGPGKNKKRINSTGISSSF
jgi:hypothetical protein